MVYELSYPNLVILMSPDSQVNHVIIYVSKVLSDLVNFEFAHDEYCAFALGYGCGVPPAVV